MIRYINELVESLLLVLNAEGMNWMGGGDQTSNATTHTTGGVHDNHTASSDWAQMLEAATQRRTEVLMPENLEDMWARGRNYRRKGNKNIKVGIGHSLSDRDLAQGTSGSKPGIHAAAEGKSSPHPFHDVGSDHLLSVGSSTRSEFSSDHDRDLYFETDHQVDEVNDNIKDLGSNNKYKIPLKRSSSSSVLGIPAHKGRPNVSEFHTPELEKHGEGFRRKSGSDMVLRRDGQQCIPKLRCRVCTFRCKS